MGLTICRRHAAGGIVLPGGSLPQPRKEKEDPMNQPATEPCQQQPAPAGDRLHLREMRAAFPHTIPVLTGFLFLGLAFGILMNSKGYGALWAVGMSLFTFAGSMQYVAVNLLTAAFNPLYAFLLTLMVNARHLFYGVSMLEPFQGLGKKKCYLIFALCDETFSILCSAKPPQGLDRGWFMIWVALLDHCYWVLGTALGSLAGALITFDTTGIDFVMTALFVVIFLNQWREQKNHLPAVVGVGASLICLVLFGPDNFLLPAMAAMAVVLCFARKNIEGRDAAC